jgi:aromatic-amino-acid transaminase
MTSLLDQVPLAARDPIIGVTEAFNADERPDKVNLGVGIYYGEDGKVPLLESVRRAEQRLAETPAPRGYLPIDGVPAFQRAVQALVFGAEAEAVRAGRVVTVQALGGTGALRVAADFLARFNRGARVWISDPSWENHRALFEAAGFDVDTYPYYDPENRGVRFDAMLETLQRLPAGAIVVLHACCHNPTGVDLDAAQWGGVLDTVTERGLVPVLDLAYQGFAAGIDEDADVVRRFAARSVPVFVANSFSKNFSLYGERVGALSLVAGDADQAARALSQLKRVVRSSYSSPPTHGASLVASVLADPELRALWVREVTAMRERIRDLRRDLVQRMEAHTQGLDAGYIARQNGMFSYSGLSKTAVAELRERHGIYAVDSGRLCVAALNARNIDHVATAVAELL